MPFQEILVPIDFSETSLHALRLAITVARASGGRITLLHVGVTPYVDVGPYGASIPNVIMDAHEQQAAEQHHALQRVAHDEIPENFPIRLQVREGFPPHEILAEAEAGKSDLICIGTNGRTGFERVVRPMGF